MSTPDRDDELEKFLAQRSVLPRALQEQESAEPPAELDRLVLRKAQAALEPSAARKVMTRNRWFVPLALAATVALSFTVVLRIQQSGNSPYAPMAGRVIEPASVSDSQDAPPQQAEAQLRRIPERVMRREIAVPQLEESETAVVANTPAPAVPVSEEITGLAKEAPESPVVSESRRSDGTEESKAYVASRAGGSLGSLQKQSRAAAESTAATTAPAPPPAPAASAADASAADAAIPDADPAAWLERIAKLRAEGKRDEAERELQAFRKRYPDYKIETQAK